MTKNKQHILKTENLAIGYISKKTQHVIASSININLKKGELIGLIGANGIGKSTLLRTLTGVQSKLNGSITIHNKHLENYSNIDLAKTLSLVLTEPLASKNLSVFELVALGRQPYTDWIGNLSKKDILIINSALKQTNMLEAKHKTCSELSDGQVQKVMISRAIAQDTDLIILDEPTTHLDMYYKAYILKLLQKLAKETNKTILFSSHEMDLAIQLCDKLIVMTKNEVLFDTPENLISKNIFNSLFPKNLIAFDNEIRRFKIKK